MPGSVGISEAKGQPVISPDIDFAMCLIGYSSASPLAAGKVSVLYSNPSTLAADYGIGDAVDAACQAVKKTEGNPAPPPVAIYPTPATTPGSYGSLVTSGIAGTAVVTTHSGSAPRGTYEIVVRVTAGGLIGTAGIVLQGSPDNGRTWLPTSALGTAATWKLYLPGTIDTGVQFDFSPSSANLTALNTLINEIYGDFNAHVILTTGTVHGSSDSADVVSIASASDTATRIARINALRAAYILHIAKGSTVHLAADAVNVLVVGAATDDATALALALDLKAKLNAHDAYLTSHTIADATNTVTSAAPSAGSLLVGDTWSVPTVPPMFGDSDLYAAGPPASGAFAAIAESSQEFAMLVVTEPVATADFATLIAGLDYGLSLGKRWTLVVRFRDPTSGETDAAYITAFRTFAAANQDNRITCVAGSGWLTDAFRAYRYLRSGLPAVLARLQSCAAIAGGEGERLAQHPGYVARGPLEGFSLVDDGDNLVGHDEEVRAGIDGPIGSLGGGLTFYRIPNSDLPGTYVSEAPVMHPSLSAIETLMDRRVANGIERVASATAWLNIQGADVFDPNTFALDDDIKDGITSKIARAITARYANEFQNARDPNLVVINPTVTVNGSKVTISGVLNVRLYGYTDTISLTFSATR